MRPLLLLLLLPLLSLAISTASALAPERISIGVSSALSGDAATYGVDMKHVVEFANKRLANGRYNLIFEDDRCDGKSAVAIAHRFTDVLKLRFVTGFVCSGAALPAAKIFNQSKVLLVAGGVSAPAISDAGPYIFRTWPSDQASAKKLFDAVSAKHTHIGAISEATEFSQGFMSSFMANVSGSKLTVDSESYLPATTDFKPLLLKFKARNVQALFLNNQSESKLALILEQLNELHWKVPLYNCFLGSSKAFLDRAGALANGLEFVDLPSLDALTPEGRSLFEEFQKEYGPMRSTEVVFFTGIEAFRALDAAISNGADPEKFLSGARFKGVVGDWWFDGNGDIQGVEPVMKRVENGAVVVLK